MEINNKRAKLLLEALLKYQQGAYKKYKIKVEGLIVELDGKDLEVSCTIKQLVELIDKLGQEGEAGYQHQHNVKSQVFKKLKIKDNIRNTLKALEKQQFFQIKFLQQSIHIRKFIIINIEDILQNFDGNWNIKKENKNHTQKDEKQIGIDFQDIFQKHTYFTGRTSVFESIDDFIENNEHGYFILEGEPGIGKTAILAQYVNRIKESGKHDYLYYFNQRWSYVNSFEKFLTYICSKLIKQYKISDLPINNISNNVVLFHELLHQVSNIISLQDKKLVIAIDGLDDVEIANNFVNIIHLQVQTFLPKKICILTTQRPIDGISYDIYAPLKIFRMIEEIKEEHWRTDIKEYIEKLEKDFKNYQNIENNNTVEKIKAGLLEKSQGNFRYVKNMLDDIKSGIYNPDKTDYFPKGLRDYYEDHLKRILKNDELENRSKFHLKIKLLLIFANANSQNPGISRSEIYRQFDEDDVYFIRELIQQWQPFLDKQEKDGNIFYNLYHPSFRHYLYEEIIAPTFREKLSSG